ncbi:uridine monophosphate kinase [Holospora curviuscula]|uniref:Uridylate kinase n=1 Tax=Holospora curviuscula TaxID=1082868 RepID=A0A2S5R7Z7_9PROT|nr:uridine monophosphate kinase [Holospora curviuscula]PPE03302.1 Uridylate kinase [Holospora curviuscula]
MFASGTRILLKLSGEALGNHSSDSAEGIVPDILKSICLQIRALSDYRWAIVVGGGNFFRGAQASWCHRSTADRMGMLATGMNGLALQEMFEHLEMRSHIFSCGVCSGIGTVYDPSLARKALKNDEIVICVGGSGLAHMTTDTTSVLRACEMDCPVILKASSVDGVYDCDPKYHKNANFLPHITYDQALAQGWNVMDPTAFTLAREFRKEILVFSILESQALTKLLEGSLRHSFISENKELKREVFFS